MRLSPAYGSPPRPLDDDGLPLDEVGACAKEKHERLRRYVDISRGARRKFARGGTTYVDLYCGTGRAIIRETNEKIDGSPVHTENLIR